ncbi:MAG: glycosyltransferase [Rhodospirillales bacterium]
MTSSKQAGETAPSDAAAAGPTEATSEPGIRSELDRLRQERDAERERAHCAELRLQQAEQEREQARALMLATHAQAAENELARRKVKNLNKRITKSTTWTLVKPFWWIERRLRDRGKVAGDDLAVGEYGISRKAYRKWVAAYDELDRGDRRAIRRHIEVMPARPRISVLMPVYNPDPAHLRAAIASVRGQLYPDWELCIVDDASTRREIAPILAELGKADPRIHVKGRRENVGIAAASNTALAMASGDYVAFLDHDDVLAPHALYMVAAELAAHPEAEFIYSDEDHLNEHGRRTTPHFKPDWNPELLARQNYICHLCVYRSDRLRSLGGLRAGTDGSQDWDLALRMGEAVPATHIRHIPFVLYHWRRYAGGGQFSEARWAEAQERGRQAVRDHFGRLGLDAQVTADTDGYNRVRLPLPTPAPRVSIIIPTRDRVDLLRACVQGLRTRTDYPDLEIIVVDNGSAEATTHAYFADLAADDRVRVLPYPGPFNYSAINNAAVRAATGDILALLNNDIEVLGPDWLASMVAHAVRPEVGAVGARLLYANMRVQHGGCVTGIQGSVAHAHVMLPQTDAGYFSRARLTQAMTAVTGACMVLRRACFDEVGGFDEIDLPVAYNDIDLCLKLRQKGYRIVYDADAELLHHESMSRGYDHQTEERRQRQQKEMALMLQRWGDALDRDPYYNPNLSSEHPFAVAFPPRTTKPWRNNG